MVGRKLFPSFPVQQHLTVYRGSFSTPRSVSDLRTSLGRREAAHPRPHHWRETGRDGDPHLVSWSPALGLPGGDKKPPYRCPQPGKITRPGVNTPSDACRPCTVTLIRRQTRHSRWPLPSVPEVPPCLFPALCRAWLSMGFQGPGGKEGDVRPGARASQSEARDHRAAHVRTFLSIHML